MDREENGKHCRKQGSMRGKNPPSYGGHGENKYTPAEPGVHRGTFGAKKNQGEQNSQKEYRITQID
jgi:hypothetical protein